MKWETVRFGDLYIVESRNGLTKPGKVRGSGYKMINMGELFANNRIYDIPMELVPLKESEKVNAKVECGDLLFARQSLVLEGAGKCSIVMEVSPLTVFESHLIRIRLDTAKALPLFYYYYFQSSLSPMRSIVSQCAQAGIRGSDLQELRVILPPLKKQQGIANILSAYDDLIENNQKQIKLLEEAAQRLYKEWFVDLRFPGHENVKIVDGVPEGWSSVAVTDLLEIKYGKDHKGLADGDIPAFGSGGIMRRVNRALYAGESVLILRKGSLNNIMLVRGEFWTIDTMFFSVPRRKNITKYVYLFLSNVDMYAMNIGAAVPSMTVKILDGIKLLCPSDEILERFEKIIEPYFTMVNTLQTQNASLTVARNLLLPKLMNRGIEV